MSGARRIVVRAVTFAAAFAAFPAFAQATDERTVEQYTCRDLIRETGPNRDTAVSFLHGFLLGKSGRSTFIVETLHKQTEAFLERCIDNPNEKAVDAMARSRTDPPVHLPGN